MHLQTCSYFNMLCVLTQSFSSFLELRAKFCLYHGTVIAFRLTGQLFYLFSNFFTNKSNSAHGHYQNSLLIGTSLFYYGPCSGRSRDFLSGKSTIMSIGPNNFGGYGIWCLCTNWLDLAPFFSYWQWQLLCDAASLLRKASLWIFLSGLPLQIRINLG